MKEQIKTNINFRLIRYENETLWMTQKAMAELFNVE